MTGTSNKKGGREKIPLSLRPDYLQAIFEGEERKHLLSQELEGHRYGRRKLREEGRSEKEKKSDRPT